MKIPLKIVMAAPAGLDPTIRTMAVAILVSLAGMGVGIFFLSFAFKQLLFVWLGIPGALYGIVRKKHPSFVVRIGWRDCVGCSPVSTFLSLAHSNFHSFPGVTQALPMVSSHPAPRISSLDGLRAFSIAAVVLGHIGDTNKFPLHIHGLEHFGNLGVKVFFVISGFLITTLLLNEQSAHGRISVGKFYARRAIKIFPDSTYIAAMLLAESAHLIVLPRGDVLHAVTYTMDFDHERGWYLNHLWVCPSRNSSTSWPAALAMSGRRRGLQLAAATLVVAPVIRLLMWSVERTSLGLHP